MRKKLHIVRIASYYDMCYLITLTVIENDPKETFKFVAYSLLRRQFFAPVF